MLGFPGLEVIKKNFMLNAAGHAIYPAHSENANNLTFMNRVIY